MYDIQQMLFIHQRNMYYLFVGILWDLGDKKRKYRDFMWPQDLIMITDIYHKLRAFAAIHLF